MRADNRGEGGIFALLALVRPLSRPQGGAPAAGRARPVRRGAALRRRGDHARRSRCSARSRASTRRHAGAALDWVWPIAARDPDGRSSRCSSGARRGSARLFGPVMALWFASIALLGIRGIAHGARGAARRSIRGTPWTSSLRDGLQGFLILGSVVLVVTGARGALRRHGALRPAADPAGLVRRGASRRCCSTTSGRGPCCS